MTFSLQSFGNQILFDNNNLNHIKYQLIKQIMCCNDISFNWYLKWRSLQRATHEIFNWSKKLIITNSIILIPQRHFNTLFTSRFRSINVCLAALVDIITVESDQNVEFSPVDINSRNRDDGGLEVESYYVIMSCVYTRFDQKVSRSISFLKSYLFSLQCIN